MVPVASQHIFLATRSALRENETSRNLKIVSIQVQKLCSCCTIFPVAPQHIFCFANRRTAIAAARTFAASIVNGTASSSRCDRARRA
jgi:hypothetical protein